MEVEGSALEMLRISRLDMGVYLCIASNGVPPAVSKRIHVSVDCKSCLRRSQASKFLRPKPFVNILGTKLLIDQPELQSIS